MKWIISLIVALFFFTITANAQTWNEQLVNPGSVVGPECMLYDHLGNPISLYKENTTLMFSYWNGSSWTACQLSNPSSLYSIGGIRIDTLFYIYTNVYNDAYYIYEVDRKGNILKHASFIANNSSYCSICYEETAEKLFLSYSPGNEYVLYIRSYDMLSNTWDDAILVDNSVSTGLYNDIAVDLSGRLWISYFDNIGRNLKVARSKNNTHTDWDIWFVDTEGYVGEYSQIWVDDSNVAHVAYYDRTNQKLKYARFNP